MKYRLKMLRLAWRIAPIGGASDGTEDDAAKAAAEKQAAEKAAADADGKTTEDPPLAAAGEKALEAFKQRAREAEAALKDRDAKIKAFEDRDKTDQERLAEEVAQAKADAEAARAEAQTAKVEADRIRVGAELKLPLDVADRIQGTTYEEMLEDGKKLAAWAKPAEATDFDGGSRTSTKSPDRDEVVRLMKEDPGEFNRRLDAGEIPADALA
jgi:Skp family chaperone for outer membrane proteins